MQKGVFDNQFLLQLLNRIIMKSLKKKDLKSKFGKFAISTEKMAKVKGGSLHCKTTNGAQAMIADPTVALGWCAQRPNCIGCF